MSDTVYNNIGTYQLNRWLTDELKDLTWVNDSGQTEKVFKAYKVANPAGVDMPFFVQGAPKPAWINLPGGPPFIVFGFSFGTGVAWEINREQAAYTIWDANTARLRVIQNKMYDLLKRFDWSAMEVNDFLAPSPFDFKFTRILTATSPDPAITEEGRQKGLLVTAFEYTRDMDQRGMLV